MLNALARTGGLPGLDASNTIVIQRSGPKASPSGQTLAQVSTEIEQVRIPLRLRPDQKVPFRPEDVLLKTGDIIFIESRDTEVYYTGGVLPVAELILPRDYDLDVMEAVTQSRGPLFNGGVNFNNLNGQIFTQGLGQASPSLLTVIRKTPKGGQITIKIDLNRAAQEPARTDPRPAGRLPDPPGDAGRGPHAVRDPDLPVHVLRNTLAAA